MTLTGHLDVAVADTTVEFTFSVTNTGTEPIDLEFRSGKSVDFAVDSDEEIWRWSDDRMFTQAVRTRTLMAGDSITQTAIWETPSPGNYTVTAMLAATDVDLTRRAGFAI